MTLGYISILICSLCLPGSNGHAPSQSQYGIGFVLSLLRNLPTIQPSTSPTWLIEFCNPTDQVTTVFSVIVAESRTHLNNQSHQLPAATCMSLWLTDQHLRYQNVGLVPGVLLVRSQLPIAVFATNIGADVDTILAVPIENFGTCYNIITMRGGSIFHILVVHRSTFVQIRPARGISAQRVWSSRQSLDTQLDSVLDIDTLSGLIQIFFRNGYEAYQVHLCQKTGQSDLSDFTGFQAVSEKTFGLIAGNCYTAVGEDGWGSHMEEMVAHNGTMGYRFLSGTPSVNMSYGLRVLTSGNVIVTLRTNKTSLRRVLHSAHLDFSEFTLDPNELFIIEVTEPAMVALMWPIHPKIGDRGALYLLPPVENWYFHYFIRTTLLSKKAAKNEFQIHLFAFTIHESGLRVNQQGIPANSPRQELEMFVRRILTLKKTTSRQSYVLYQMNKARFSAYVTDISSNWALIHSAGQAFKNIHTEKMMCKKSRTMSPDDDLDNDCDGLYNEESVDGEDNDGDGLIDEDISDGHIERELGTDIFSSRQALSSIAGAQGSKSQDYSNYGSIVISGIVAGMTILCGASYALVQAIIKSDLAENKTEILPLRGKTVRRLPLVSSLARASRDDNLDEPNRFIEPMTKKVKVHVKMKELKKFDEASNAMT